MPRLVAMGESPIYGGAGYAAIKRIGASEVKGVSVMPLAIGFLGLRGAAWAASWQRGFSKGGRQSAGIEPGH